MTEDRISLYTDGACRHNPGKGGFAAILFFGHHKKIISKGFRLTTNNRMELMAVIAGLMSIKKRTIPVSVYSDSKYVIDAIKQKWVYNWAKKNFKGKKNADLWKIFLQLEKTFHVIEFNWVKGHANHPLNEECDLLATQAADHTAIEIDTVFEQESKELF